MPSKKRQRLAMHTLADQDAAWAPREWLAAASWLRSCGGTVHEALTMDASRQVKVVTNVAEDEVLLRIPDRCLLTLSAAEDSTVGPNLFRSVSAVKSRLHFPPDDVALALFLATELACLGPFQHYVGTLPAAGSYAGLPRRWSEKKLRRLLTGSPLLERARSDRAGVSSDYALVSEAWRAGGGQPPPLEAFDQALAAVGSRAFSRLGPDGLDALVPFLDLLDHCRGQGRQKDVRYFRTSDGHVEVRAHHAVDVGSTLRDTYGAKGNGQLLSCYGFCLARNVEPDGSSNDVLDFELPQGAGHVHLQVGPKAYAYGPFVKAVEFLMFAARRNAQSMQDKGKAKASSSKKAEEVEALKAFGVALEAAMNRYALQGAALVLARQDDAPEPDRSAAILVESEQRTLGFFLGATRLALQRLARDKTGSLVKEGAAELQKAANVTLSRSSDADSHSCSDENCQLVRELIDTYMKIRHP